MNRTQYRYILYFIVLVILSTIALQIYWNYKNYQVNKAQLVNQVQTTLDNAIEQYYANLAQERTISLAVESPDFFINFTNKIDSVKLDIDSTLLNVSTLGRIDLDHEFPKTQDSLMIALRGINPDSLKTKSRIVVSEIQGSSNDSVIDHFRTLTSKVIFSLTQDTLKLKEIDSIFSKELKRKNINLDYELVYGKFETLDSISHHSHNRYTLSTRSSSTFLPFDQNIEINFNNTATTVLKRISGSLILSTLLVLGVIGCLFYLLNIIKKQKELAEIKNDLIGNITHEFKTPISTIGIALESISDFRAMEDKERTLKYLNMSREQLGKLNIMVEKLLETATLDSDELHLDIDSLSLNKMISELVLKFKTSNPERPIDFLEPNKEIIVQADPFHLENAINNIIDNAIKYGGEQISISLSASPINAEITIFDSGTSLDKSHTEKIFDKFYRVPKGNTHDVKGFGIGLYYSKSIIEKHQGKISLDLQPKGTTFKILLSYGQAN